MAAVSTGLDLFPVFVGIPNMYLCDIFERFQILLKIMSTISMYLLFFNNNDIRPDKSGLEVQNQSLKFSCREIKILSFLLYVVAAL